MASGIRLDQLEPEACRPTPAGCQIPRTSWTHSKELQPGSSSPWKFSSWPMCSSMPACASGCALDPLRCDALCCVTPSGGLAVALMRAWKKKGKMERCDAEHRPRRVSGPAMQAINNSSAYRFQCQEGGVLISLWLCWLQRFAVNLGPDLACAWISGSDLSILTATETFGGPSHWFQR